MQLTKEQSTQFEQFISKLPISKVRSDIESLWREVKDKGFVIRTDQLDKLKESSSHIEDVSLQSFIQSFEHWVKSEDGSKSPEKIKKEEPKDAKLGEGVANSIKKSKTVDKDIDDNSVYENDDTDNVSAPLKIKDKKEKAKELTEEAKKGDLHRPISGMKDHATKPKYIVNPKVIIEKKPAHKK